MAGGITKEQKLQHKLRSKLGLTSSEAARYLGVSLGSVRRWSDMGYLECNWTPGGQRRFTREQLDAVANGSQ